MPHTECLILRLRKAGNKDKTARTLATIGDQPVRREASAERRGGLGGPVVVTTRKSKYEGAVPKSRGTLIRRDGEQDRRNNTKARVHIEDREMSEK